MNTDNQSEKKIPKRMMPSEEAMAFAELIGPIPGLRILPDPDSEPVVAAVKRVLAEYKEMLTKAGHVAMAEVMVRCSTEIDRMTLPPVIDNIRYQLGAAVITLALPTESPTPASS